MKLFKSTWFLLLNVVLWIAGIVGYVMNLVKIFTSGPIAFWDAIEFLRAVGIFVFPLGSLMGLFF